jgi:AraC-like DNA-binding protein
MEEAQGFRALLSLDEPHYTIEQIAAKMGKSPAYVTTRLKLTGMGEMKRDNAHKAWQRIRGRYAYTIAICTAT